MNFEKGEVYYNPYTGLLAQYRGGNLWGMQTLFFEDAQTVIDNEPTIPPWWLREQFIHCILQESNIIAKHLATGYLCSAKWLHTMPIADSWTTVKVY